MKFYEVPLHSMFTVPDDENKYVKIKEERISCCKVKCNAKKVSDETEVVFKPMQDIVEVIEP